MIEFKESKFYKLLQDFFINNNKETFLQLLAEFYNMTEGIIDKNKNQDELIKELRELYIKFNEEGIDENKVREKVNYFLENSVKIKDIIVKLITNTNNIEDITSELDRCAKKSEVVKKGQVDLDEMTERTLQAIENGQGTSFNLLSIPRDNSVTLKKINGIVFPTNKNLLDDITIEEGKQLNATGGTTTFQAEELVTTDFIEVAGNTSYYFSILEGSLKYALRVCYYDNSKTFISTAINLNLINTPSNCTCLKLTYKKESNIESTLLQKGTSRTEIEKALYKGIKTEGEEEIKNEIDLINNKKIVVSDFKEIVYPTNKNLLEGISIEEGKQLNTTGNITSYQADDKFTSDFIEVISNTNYFYSSLTGTIKYAIRIAFYNSTKTFISYLDSRDSFVTPNDTKYIKITGYLNQKTDMVLQLGTERTEIELPTVLGFKTEGEEKIKAELEKIKTNGLLTEKIIDCWGDSLTAGSGADETHKYPYVLAQLTGLTVNQFGVGGETTATIASRQGGMPMVINNITIPKSGSVAINELKNLDGTKVLPCLQHGARGINPCFINDIEGTLSYNNTNSNWEFTRATSGNEISINRPTIIKTNAMINNRNNIMIIWAGTNDNTTDATNIIRLEKLMIDYSKCKDYLILSPPTGSKTSMANMEKQFLEAFGNRYINTREYLCTYGMEDAGLTPSESDLTDMANGIIPMSLKNDPTHGNNYYYPIIANLVYKRLKELNII